MIKVQYKTILDGGIHGFSKLWRNRDFSVSIVVLCIIVSLYTDLTLDGIQLIEFHDGYFHSIL